MIFKVKILNNNEIKTKVLLMSIYNKNQSKKNLKKEEINFKNLRRKINKNHRRIKRPQLLKK